MKTPKTHLAVRVLALLVPLAWAGRTEGAETFEFEKRTYTVFAAAQEPTYIVRLVVSPEKKDSENTEAHLLFSYRDSDNLYSLDVNRQGYGLRRVAGGKEKILHGCICNPFAEGAVDLRVHRSQYLLSVIANGSVLMEVFDETFGAGKAAVSTTGLKIEGEPACQETVPLDFGDDFQRAPNQTGISQSWVQKRGEWKLHSVVENVDNINVNSLPESRRPDAERSPNPFSMNALTKDWALLVTGQWFWTDYEAAVSLQNPGGVMGLVFCHQSGDDYFLVRFTIESTAPEPSPIELVRVESGKETVLARAYVMAQTLQWYRLGVRTLGRRIQVELDDAPVIDAEHGQCRGGMIGLYAASCGNEATFDDVNVVSTSIFAFDNRRWIRDYTSILAGDWEFGIAPAKGRPASGTIWSVGGRGSLLFGPQWLGPGVVSARVEEPRAGESVGIILDYSGPGKPYHVIRWRGADKEDDKSRVQLVRVDEDKLRVLAESMPPELLPGATHELLVDLRTEREVRAYVDDWTALRKHLPKAIGGRPGLHADAQRELAFRNVYHAFERIEDKERPPQVRVFQEDPFMKHWSSASGAWWPVWEQTNAYWHVGDFYGRSTISLPLNAGLLLVHSASMVDSKGGYAVEILPYKPEKEDEQAGRHMVRLSRLGKTVQEAIVPKQSGDNAVTGIDVHKDGAFLWICAGDTELITYQDTEPLRSPRVALKSTEAVNLEAIKIQRYNVEDHYFERAPAGWRRIGKWEVMNRFVCDPRWSHMAGKSLTTATLLDNTEFFGDLTIESYMGMRMQRGDLGLAGNYPRVGDINMSMFTDGSGLDSGYSFILQGWDTWWSETWSNLMRLDNVLQRSDREFVPRGRERSHGERPIRVPWISKGRPIHGAWYYLKARRQAHKVQYFFDSEPVFDYYDPEPLDKWGRPAIWTLYNSICVARVKISYSHKRTPNVLCDPPADRPEPPAPAPQAIVRSESHPGVVYDFESGDQGWSATDRDDSARVRAVTHKGKACLEVLNTGIGGEMGCQVQLPVPLPVDRAVLDFDYQLRPGTSVNAYLDMGGRAYFIELTGAQESLPNIQKIGEIAGAKADGRWHHARFPLHEIAPSIASTAKDELALTVLRFGNLHPGYLWAGFGGNRSGSGYRLDNVTIQCYGPPDVKAQWQLAEGKGDFSVALSRKADAVPPPEAGGSAELTRLEPGQWFLHVRAGTDKGWGSPVHYPFIVAKPLTLVRAEPGTGDKWNLGPIKLWFSPAAAQLDVRKLSLHINGVQVNPTDHRSVQYDAASRRLTIDPNWVGCVLDQSSKMRLSGTAVDVLGSTCTLDIEVEADASLDKFPPTPVQLTNICANGSGRVVPYRFFDPDRTPLQGIPGMESYGSRVVAEAPGGPLSVCNLGQGGSFGLYLVSKPFNAGRFPLLCFDYAINRGVSLDVRVQAGNGNYYLAFTDKSPGASRHGEVRDVTQDGRWHHAEVDLYTALSVQQFQPRHYDVSGVALMDTGYVQNAPGANYMLDRISLVPVVSGTKFGPVHWKAHDASGIKGYGCVWSTEAQAEVPEKITHTSPQAVFSGIPGPDCYLHIRAQDVSGNWGPSEHFRFRVDNECPEFGKPTPRPGSKSASNILTLPVADVGSGVDPETLVVSIDGHECKPGSAGTAYELTKGVCTWDWRIGRPPKQEAIPNGKEIKVTASVCDFAGNKAKPLEWSWIMDYSRDKTPPSLPAVTCASHKVHLRDEFVDSAGGWRRMSSTAEATLVPRGEKGGDNCMCLHVVREGNSAVEATRQDFNPAEHPIISFDYAIPPPVKIDMHVQANGQWYTIGISGRSSSHPVVGRIANIAADGQWHSAYVDINAILQTVKALKGKTVKVTRIYFGDAASSPQGNKAGYRCYVDNFMICSAGAKKADFGWSALDITGIKAYSIAFDQSPNTFEKTSEQKLPEKPNTDKASASFVAPKPGAYYLHVCAQDNGGNWGDVTHYFYYVPE